MAARSGSFSPANWFIFNIQNSFMPISEIFNEHNMAGMKRYPDKFFDLAIIDPPYGIDEDGESNRSRGSRGGSRKSNHLKNNTLQRAIPPTMFKAKDWDKEPPPIAYFTELKRVSKDLIIWGANHFISKIPDADSSCWIVWDKDNGTTDFADCELAYTSFESAVRMVKIRWNGMLQHDMKRKEIRIHPTQKPVKLYKWLLHKYAKPGFKILDTHMGSQSSRIAAFHLGFDFYGWEIDEDYFKEGDCRFKQETAQFFLL